MMRHKTTERETFDAMHMHMHTHTHTHTHTSFLVVGRNALYAQDRSNETKRRTYEVAKTKAKGRKVVRRCAIC